MTGETGAGHFAVIDPGGRLPGACAVAGLAGIARCDVPGMLASGFNTIMTTHTAGGDPAVIEVRITPVGGCVADVAFVAAVYVTG